MFKGDLIWMKKTILDLLKVLFVFVICTFVFYLGLRTLHAEYEKYQQYDLPEGSAIKVIKSEDSIFDRMNLFFRLGE